MSGNQRMQPEVSDSVPGLQVDGLRCQPQKLHPLGEVRLPPAEGKARFRILCPGVGSTDTGSTAGGLRSRSWTAENLVGFR